MDGPALQDLNTCGDYHQPSDQEWVSDRPQERRGHRGTAGCGLPRGTGIFSHHSQSPQFLLPLGPWLLFFILLSPPNPSSLLLLLPWSSLPHPPLTGMSWSCGAENVEGWRGGRPELFIGTGAAPSISSVWSWKPSIINTLAPPQLCFP